MAFKWQHTLCSCRSSLVAVEDNGKLCLASDFFPPSLLPSADLNWNLIWSHSIFYSHSRLALVAESNLPQPAAGLHWIVYVRFMIFILPVRLWVCVYLCLHYIYNKPSHLVKQQAFYNVGDFWSWFFWLNFFPKLLSKSALLLFFFWKTKSQNVMCHWPTWFGLGIFTVLVVWNFLVHSWDK